MGEQLESVRRAGVCWARRWACFLRASCSNERYGRRMRMTNISLMMLSNSVIIELSGPSGPVVPYLFCASFCNMGRSFWRLVVMIRNMALNISSSSLLRVGMPNSLELRIAFSRRRAYQANECSKRISNEGRACGFRRCRNRSMAIRF